MEDGRRSGSIDYGFTGGGITKINYFIEDGDA